MYCHTKNIFFLLLILSVTINELKCEDYLVTDQVYFDIEHDGAYLGQIVVGLFGEVAPKTVANFKFIASRGINGKSYEGTKFHRVVPRFMIQGGDIINNDGTGSTSIYGKFFKDENFTVKHEGPGLVSTANGGPNTNGCQFFITTIQTPWLDGKHTIFGKVVEGQAIVHKIEHLKTDSDDRPLRDVVIIRSGLKKTKPFYEPSVSYELSLWGWLKAGWFPLSFSFAILAFFHIVMMQLDTLSTKIGA